MTQNAGPRVCVVTGSASGIGRATATLLEQQGHRVIGVDLVGAQVLADLSTIDGRRSMTSAVAKLSGGSIDAVFAIAGVGQAGSLAVQVNYFGAVATLEGLRPLLADSPHPRAVTVSSIAARWSADSELLDALVGADEALAIRRAETMAGQGAGAEIYPTTKRALSRWVRRVATNPEWAGASIPLNAVAPGAIDTPMMAHSLGSADDRAKLAERIPMPLNGPAQPIVIAQALAWLGGEHNTHMAGQTVYVDGGAEAVQRSEDHV